MKKKVYRVTVSKEIWILAHDESEAEREAKFCADDDLASWEAFAVEVKTPSSVPPGVKSSLVWGSQDEITVVEAIQKNQPPTIRS